MGGEQWYVVEQMREYQRLREVSGVLLQLAMQVALGCDVDKEQLKAAAQEVGTQNLITHGALTAGGYSIEEIQSFPGKQHRGEGVADRRAAEIDEMAARGAQCLVLEDALSRPSDLALKRSGPPVAFLNESVFAWCELPAVPRNDLPGKVIRLI